ncbi:hypothetical protein NUACC21_19780 [Scytonema sp. NUACC21]
MKLLFRPLSWSISLVGFCLVGIAASPVLGDQNVVTETFNVQPVSCEGLNLNGVLYSFTVANSPNLDCVAGLFFGPGATNNIQPPNIEGNASGVLHLTFDKPTTVFGFGVAQSVFGVPQSVIITLNRPGAGVLRQEVQLTTTNDPFFVGGRYDYDGPAVKSVSISFSNSGGRFALDNVSYFRPPALSD